MLPNPLHPALIHLPIVLAFLLPLAAIISLIMIQRRGKSRARWIGVVILNLALVGSAWLAVETGENEEEVVEEVVGEAALEEHEAAGNRLLFLSVLALSIGLIGVAPGRVGVAGRMVATVATLAVLPAVYVVGHTGGELVYTHGAAAAYTVSDGGGSRDGDRLIRSPSHKEDEDDEPDR